MLQGTLQTSGQWGAVRVCPGNVQFVDVSVSGKIVESTGARLALQVTVKDSAGRIWVNNERYASSADTSSYKTDVALKARDPFQNVYVCGGCERHADERAIPRVERSVAPDVRRRKWHRGWESAGNPLPAIEPVALDPAH